MAAEVEPAQEQRRGTAKPPQAVSSSLAYDRPSAQEGGSRRPSSMNTDLVRMSGKLTDLKAEWDRMSGQRPTSHRRYNQGANSRRPSMGDRLFKTHGSIKHPSKAAEIAAPEAPGMPKYANAARLALTGVLEGDNEGPTPGPTPTRTVINNGEAWQHPVTSPSAQPAGPPSPKSSPPAAAAVAPAQPDALHERPGTSSVGSALNTPATTPVPHSEHVVASGSGAAGAAAAAGSGGAASLNPEAKDVSVSALLTPAAIAAANAATASEPHSQKPAGAAKAGAANPPGPLSPKPETAGAPGSNSAASHEPTKVPATAPHEATSPKRSVKLSLPPAAPPAASTDARRAVPPPRTAALRSASTSRLPAPPADYTPASRGAQSSGAHLRSVSASRLPAPPAHLMPASKATQPAAVHPPYVPASRPQASSPKQHQSGPITQLPPSPDRPCVKLQAANRKPPTHPSLAPGTLPAPFRRPNMPGPTGSGIPNFSCISAPEELAYCSQQPAPSDKTARFTTPSRIPPPGEHALPALHTSSSPQQRAISRIPHPEVKPQPAPLPKAHSTSHPRDSKSSVPAAAVSKSHSSCHPWKAPSHHSPPPTPLVSPKLSSLVPSQGDAQHQQKQQKQALQEERPGDMSPTALPFHPMLLQPAQLSPAFQAAALLDSIKAKSLSAPNSCTDVRQHPTPQESPRLVQPLGLAATRTLTKSNEQVGFASANAAPTPAQHPSTHLTQHSGASEGSGAPSKVARDPVFLSKLLALRRPLPLDMSKVAHLQAANLPTVPATTLASAQQKLEELDASIRPLVKRSSLPEPGSRAELGRRMGATSPTAVEGGGAPKRALKVTRSNHRAAALALLAGKSKARGVSATAHKPAALPTTSVDESHRAGGAAPLVLGKEPSRQHGSHDMEPSPVTDISLQRGLGPQSSYLRLSTHSVIPFGLVVHKSKSQGPGQLQLHQENSKNRWPSAPPPRELFSPPMLSPGQLDVKAGKHRPSWNDDRSSKTKLGAGGGYLSKEPHPRFSDAGGPQGLPAMDTEQYRVPGGLWPQQPGQPDVYNQSQWPVPQPAGQQLYNVTSGGASQGQMRGLPAWGNGIGCQGQDAGAAQYRNGNIFTYAGGRNANSVVAESLPASYQMWGVGHNQMTTGWAALPHEAQMGALSAFNDVWSQRQPPPLPPVTAHQGPLQVGAKPKVYRASMGFEGLSLAEVLGQKAAAPSGPRNKDNDPVLTTAM